MFEFKDGIGGGLSSISVPQTSSADLWSILQRPTRQKALQKMGLRLEAARMSLTLSCSSGGARRSQLLQVISRCREWCDTVVAGEGVRQLMAPNGTKLGTKLGTRLEA